MLLRKLQSTLHTDAIPKIKQRTSLDFYSYGKIGFRHLRVVSHSHTEPLCYFLLRGCLAENKYLEY